ncbi:MAG: twin-arginine translocase TatA/TatE family subunit [bacterium]|nr:twin-arginine translocase TatA/TatE family subunit [bacterium]MDE0374686.1 twin-arginine translocase TatA/TatE family subunit [bacterium]MXY78034.1 twin-arginine translocase TatA/TatE family subunit [Acidimicrobiia bacterium]
MIPKIQGGEIIVILVVILLLFGARKLPELARSLGSSAREFRKGIEEGRTEEQDEAAPTTTISDSSTTTSGTET